jgi:hypothetical protein
MDQTHILQLRNVFSASYINLHIIRTALKPTTIRPRRPLVPTGQGAPEKRIKISKLTYDDDK